MYPGAADDLRGFQGGAGGAGDGGGAVLQEELPGGVLQGGPGVEPGQPPHPLLLHALLTAREPRLRDQLSHTGITCFSRYLVSM